MYTAKCVFFLQKKLSATDMTKIFFKTKNANAFCKKLALCSVVLLVVNCGGIEDQNNITEQEHEEILDATNELGSSKKDPKAIETKLARVKGTALGDPKGHDLIKRTFATKDPKKVQALILDGRSIKNSAPDPWAPICNGSTTMMDLLLDNVLGDNDQANSRVFGKRGRDDWRDLTNKFLKAMTSHHDKLETFLSRDGNPILKHYMMRTIRGNWRHTTEQLIDVWEKNSNAKDYIPLINLLAEESKKNSRDKKKWGDQALRLIKKCGKQSPLANDASNHRALITFIQEDWDNPNVPGEIVKFFGTAPMLAEVKHLYAEMLPRMIEKNDTKVYATSFDYIINGLGEASCNPKTLTEAIKAKHHDMLLKILHEGKDSIIHAINSRYGDAKNLVAFYAQPKYYPGRSKFETFLSAIKEKIGADAFKRSVAVANGQAQSLKMTQEVMDIFHNKATS